MSTNPKRTLELLDALEKLGFDDDAFQRLHHLQPRTESIARHRYYCKKTEEFRPGGTNERLQQRLAFVLETYRALGNTKDFVTLAELAYATI